MSQDLRGAEVPRENRGDQMPAHPEENRCQGQGRITHLQKGLPNAGGARGRLKERGSRVDRIPDEETVPVLNHRLAVQSLHHE